MEIISNYEETQVNLPQSSLKSVKITEPKINDSMMDNLDFKKELTNLDETGKNVNGSHPLSAISKFSEQVILKLYFQTSYFQLTFKFQSAFSGIVSGSDYKKFIFALTSFLVGDDQLTDWITNGT